MVEKKFKVPKTFALEQRIDDIGIKVREISGVDVTPSTIRPQVPGYNGTTYVLNGEGLKVVLRYDPDAIAVDREGLSIYISASQEEQICKVILDVLGLKE